MPLVASLAVITVAIVHALIAMFEMLLWKQPFVYTRLERFRFTQAEANKMAPIVANAGLYNLFVALGLVWSMLIGEPRMALFFLSFVIVAGVFGAATLKKTTLILQTVPAALAALVVPWS